MEELIVTFLELLCQWEDPEAEEFDFAKLRQALQELKQKSGELLRMEKEHQLLRRAQIGRVLCKARALQAACPEAIGAVRDLNLAEAHKLGAERLLELEAALCEDVNRALSTRPHFHKTTASRQKKQYDEGFRIGG